VGLAGSETKSAKYNTEPGPVYGHNEHSGEAAAARSRGSLRLIEPILSIHSNCMREPGVTVQKQLKEY